MSKNLFYTAVALVVMAYFGMSSAYDCSSIVVKESEGVLSYLGNVTFTVPYTVDEWIITGMFDQDFTGVGAWFAYVRYGSGNDPGFVEFSNREEYGHLEQGEPFSFRFRVNFGRDIPIPALISLKFEDTELCR